MHFLPHSCHFYLHTQTSIQYNSFHFPSSNPYKAKPKPVSKNLVKDRPDNFQTIKSQMTNPTNPNPVPESAPNTGNTRLHELKQFDDSKIGVKGLVDRGLTTIPSIFVHPSPPDPIPNSRIPSDPKPTIPVIDFSSPRSTIVEQVRQASASLGFFQIINHSVPSASINKILHTLKGFYELPESVKMEYYMRDLSHGAAYSTNFDLYQSKAASWRDSFQIRMGPTPPDWDYVPESCREAIMEWDNQVLKISEELMGILCEGLGLGNPNRLKEMSCLDARIMVSHYYPYCPQPELTAGLASHTDPGVLTVLVQNEVPGLQVKVGEQWVDVEPVEGAIVINIGDILQIMSNDEYKSVEHRVRANPLPEARVSVAVFLNPGLRENLYGPFPELVSVEKPALYQQFIFSDYMKRFFSKELDGKTLTNYYRI